MDVCRRSRGRRRRGGSKNRQECSGRKEVLMQGAEEGSRGKTHFIIFIYKVNIRVTELTQLTCSNKDMNDQINTGLIESNDNTVRPSLI